MFSKALNAVLLVVLMLVLLGPLAIYDCKLIGIALPPWATSEEAEWLEGGVLDADFESKMGTDGFASGALQKTIENGVESSIPFKASVMLANAALQRSVIAVANAPFGWDCYPTYYGSLRLLIPSQNALTYMPEKKSAEREKELKAFGEGVAAVASRYPNVKFVVCAVQGYRQPAANPALALVNDAENPSDLAKAIDEGIQHKDNVLFVSPGYDDVEEYYSEFFKSDHHWNHLGAERAYNEMAGWLGLPAFEDVGEIALEDYLFSGATARWGLGLIGESVSDSAHDFSHISVVNPDGSVQPYNHEAFFEQTYPGKRFTFYDLYYDFMSDGTELLGDGQGKCLIVCNSFGGLISRYLAEGHSSVTVDRALHPAFRSAMQRLDRMIANEGYDTVLFVGNPGDIASFAAQCPKYFDVA